MAAEFERVLALDTGFGSVVVGRLERGRAFGTSVATIAGVSIVPVVGLGATASAAAAPVAAMPELRGPSPEEDTVSGQPKTFGN